MASSQAIADGGGLRQVEQGAREVRVFHRKVHAADEVGLVFLFRQPARAGTGRTVFGQGEHRRTACLRFDEGVGMDGDEQVGMRLACLFHAPAQRDEVIAVADEDGAHARRVVDLRLESARDGESHILFMRAAPSVCARVFAAVPGIHGDEQHAVAEFGACQWHGFGDRLGRQRA